MLTRCPHCRTAFRVKPEQLKVRQGRVRCGACQAVFNAVENLEEAPSPVAAPATVTAAAAAVPAGHVSVELPQPEPPPPLAAPEPIPEPDPELVAEAKLEPKLDPIASEPPGAEPASLLVTASPTLVGLPRLPDIELDPPPVLPSVSTEPAVAAPADIPLPDLSLALPPLASAEIAASAPIPGLPVFLFHPATDPISGQPVPPSPALPEPDAGATAAGMPHWGDDPFVSDYHEFSDAPLPVAQPASRGVTDTEFAADPESAPDGVFAAEPPPFATSMLPEPVRYRRWPWVLGILLALPALLIQVVLNYRVELSLLAPEYKPMLRSFSETFGYDLPLPNRIEKLMIDTSDLHPEPKQPGQFLLNATLRNRAPFALAWPSLELTLTDANDKALVRRVLAPADYLSGDRPLAAGFAAHTDESLRLVVNAPGVPAVGYRLYIFYP